MRIDLGRFEDFGYADVLQTGLSGDEVERRVRAKAKKLGVKVIINRTPLKGVVLDVKTGRCFRID